MKKLLFSAALFISSIGNATVYFQSNSPLPFELRAKIEISLNAACARAFAFSEEIYEDTTTVEYADDMTWKENVYTTILLASAGGNAPPYKIKVLSRFYSDDLGGNQQFDLLALKAEGGICTEY